MSITATARPRSGNATHISEAIVAWRVRLGPKSPNTIRIYTRSAERLATYLETGAYPDGAPLPTGVSVIGPLELTLFFDSLASGERRLAEASRSQIYRALQRFFAFLVEEGEVRTSPMDRVPAPSQKRALVSVIDIDDLRRLVATCTTDTFEDRRDLAILRLLIDTGMRIGELAAMTVHELELERARITVVGTGGTRQLLLEPKTVGALRRYLHARRGHRAAGRPELWLAIKGNRTGVMTHWGLRQVVERRVERAGLTGRIHPHTFRHTHAHRWLANGGQEHDLMHNAGRKSPSLLVRDGAVAAERARQAAVRSGLAEQI